MYKSARVDHLSYVTGCRAKQLSVSPPVKAFGGALEAYADL